MFKLSKDPANDNIFHSGTTTSVLLSVLDIVLTKSLEGDYISYDFLIYMTGM